MPTATAPTEAGPALAERAQSLLADLAGPAATLRPDQLVAVEALVSRRARVLVVQRTGWGKSAVYWIATRLLRDAGAGPTLVVSPLLALMRDQVDAAARAGVVARTINSTNVDDWRAIEGELTDGTVDVLLISPERLNNAGFRANVLPRLTAAIGMLVVDEAHCISDWGHDFRPDYRRLVTVIDGLGPGVPVLATTATANERVTADVATQLGTGTVTLRGPLDRESLGLGVVELPTGAERLTWLAEALADETFTGGGSGIVYCLTVAEVERVAAWLQGQGVGARAYTGATEAAEREVVEADLKANRLQAVVATSALGMGYDKPDLAFVVHLGSPSSPIAYYQQVGRAGRAIATARAVLLPAEEDRAIWAYFDSTAFPPREMVERVLAVVADKGPIGVPTLEGEVNLRRGRLEALLKVLDVEGAVEKVAAGWVSTGRRWAYDDERLARVAATRLAEQEAMVAYAGTDGCRMAFLRRSLDDAGAAACGRCDRCTSVPFERALPRARIEAALAHLRSGDIVLEPRKQWARGVEGRKGTIPLGRRADHGRALALGADAGWGTEVAAALAADAPVTDDLLAGLVAVLKRWSWVQRPTWVTWVPSRTYPQLVRSMAERIAAVGKLEVVDAVARVHDASPPQARMQNATRQCANVADAFAVVADHLPTGPALVVDDTSSSGWTMTVVAEALLAAGADAVLPLVLWRRP
jgi:ATP-dependent DNA helicase RecQ